MATEKCTLFYIEQNSVMNQVHDNLIHAIYFLQIFHVIKYYQNLICKVNSVPVYLFICLISMEN